MAAPIVGASAARDDGFYQAPESPLAFGVCGTGRYEILRGLLIGPSACYEYLWDTAGPMSGHVLTIPAEVAGRFWRFQHGGLWATARVGYFRRWESGQPDTVSDGSTVIAQGATYQAGLEMQLAQSATLALRVGASARLDLGSFVAGGRKLDGADALGGGVYSCFGIDWGHTSNW
jgi:hypothetical protein